MSIWKSFLIVSVFFLTTYYILPATRLAHAQDLSLAVSSGLFDIELFPGSPQEGSVGVINTSLVQAIPVRAQLTLWNLKEDSDDVEFVTAEPALNATQWFYIQTDAQKKTYEPFAAQDFIIEPDHTREIYFRIVPPSGATPGTYLVSMRFQAALPDSFFNSGGPHLLPEIDTLFFLKVKSLSLDDAANPNQYRASIISLEPAEKNRINFFHTAHASVFDNAVNELLLKIRNEGLYYFKTTGTVEVRNLFGRVVERTALPSRYLIPNRTRTFTIKTAATSAPNGFFAVCLAWLRDQLYIGPYTATVVLEYPLSAPAQLDVKTGVFAQGSARFWIFPWKLIVGLILLVALIRFIYQRGSRRWRLAWRTLLGQKI